MRHGMAINQDRFAEPVEAFIQQGLQLVVIGTPMAGDALVRLGGIGASALDEIGHESGPNQQLIAHVVGETGTGFGVFIVRCKC